MAGAGFDAAMIKGSGSLKERLGRVAYVDQRLGEPSPEGVRGQDQGRRGNLVQGQGDVPAARQRRQALRRRRGVRRRAARRRLARARGRDRRRADPVGAHDGPHRGRIGRRDSPFVQVTKARSVEVELDRKVLYELDGGDRTKVKAFKVEVEPGAVSVCVPARPPERLAFPGRKQVCWPPATGGISMSVSRSADAPARPRQRARLRATTSSTRGPSRCSRAPGSSRAASVYAIIGVLAFRLAIGAGGKITNQQGAFQTVAHQSFGHVLLVLLAIGLGGYSLWRLVRAGLGHGPEGSDSGFDRVAALASGLAYGVLCFIAVEVLMGSASSSGNANKTTGGVLGWPGGTWIVGIAGVVMIGVGSLPGLPRDHPVVPQGLQDRGDVTRDEALDCAGRDRRLSRPHGRVRPGRDLPRQGGGRLRPEAAVGLDGALAKVLHQTYGVLSARARRGGARRVRGLLAERRPLPPNLSRVTCRRPARVSRARPTSSASERSAISTPPRRFVRFE